MTGREPFTGGSCGALGALAWLSLGAGSLDPHGSIPQPQIPLEIWMDAS